MSPDTGAREPQDSVSALLQTTQQMRGRAERVLAGAQEPDLPFGWLQEATRVAVDVVALTEEVERLAALAAGVGVPPDEDQVAQSAKNADVRERLREEWEALGLMSYSGMEGGFVADLNEDDIAEIRALLREADCALANVPPDENQDLGGALHKGRGDARAVSELDWPIDVRQLARAVELLERCVEVVDPDTNLDLLADVQRFLGAS